MPFLVRLISLTRAPRRWQFQFGGTQVAEWINYDRLALAATYLQGGTASRELTGAALRAYWAQHPAVTRLRAAIVHDLTRSLSLRFIGDNLLDRQRDEPDNVTIVPGRTLSLGVGARFSHGRATAGGGSAETAAPVRYSKAQPGPAESHGQLRALPSHVCACHSRFCS